MDENRIFVIHVDLDWRILVVVAIAVASLIVVYVRAGAQPARIDFLRLYITAYTGQRIVFEIRNAIFDHLSQLSFSFCDRARTGDLPTFFQ